MTTSQIQFGIAPKRTKEVEYVDDVIIMEEGDKAIRSMGGNGMSWTFDANAPHVSEFQEGKVVFATGLAVGRVVGLKREGGTVTATLAPIQLTDVIKNGSFAMSQAITTDNMISYAAPDFPQEPETQPEEKKSSYNIDEGPNDRAVQTMVLSNVKNGKWTPTSVAQTYADGRRVTYQKLGAKWSSGHVSLANVSPLQLVNGYERVRLSMPPPGDPAISRRASGTVDARRPGRSYPQRAGHDAARCSSGKSRGRSDPKPISATFEQKLSQAIAALVFSSTTTKKA